MGLVAGRSEFPREQERLRLLVSVDRANRGIAVHVQVVEDHQHGLDARRSLFAWKSGRRRRGEVIGETSSGLVLSTAISELSAIAAIQ